MKLLNLDSGDEAATPNKKKSKWLKIGIGVSALVLIPTIGSTLAGSISINAGSGVEFGQGVVSTASCDSSISVAPTSTLTFTTASIPLPVFEILSIRVSLVDYAACDGKTFRITAYNASGVQVDLCSSTNYVDVAYDSANAGSELTSSCGLVTAFQTDGMTTDGFDLVPGVTVLAGDVSTITIESIETT